MTRVLPRTHFHSSRLIRCLADLAIVEHAEPGNAFAEKLGQWVHFADAIALSAIHSDSVASLPKARPASQAGAQAGAERDRVQTLLAKSIAQSCAPTARNAHIKLPEPPRELPLDIAAAYLPYRRFYEAHQRDMELQIQPLRFNLRQALAKASPGLRKLAELDAALEKILRDRESKLLSRVPVLLKKHFERLFREHQQKLADSGQADDPVRWMQPGAWLARFCNDLQMLLLTELELRLQPATGLIEAFNQET